MKEVRGVQKAQRRGSKKKGERYKGEEDSGKFTDEGELKEPLHDTCFCFVFASAQRMVKKAWGLRSIVKV